MNADIFEQLAHLPILQNIADLIGRLIGINVVLLGLDGKKTAQLTSGMGPPEFCRALQSSSRGHSMCLECDRSQCQSVLKSRKAISYLCHAGIREFIIPIMVEGQVQAFIQCGQVLDAQPDNARWLAMRQRLQTARIDKVSVLESLYMRMPYVALQAQEDLMAILELLGNYIAESQQMRIHFHEKGDSQIVYRARSYILSCLAESVCLDDVARAAFTSKRNLTRVFRLHEGQTVLSYLHRQRINQACRLLRESDYPCARIAFETGFGSLQQFNRVFRKATGQSPSQWRKL